MDLQLLGFVIEIVCFLLRWLLGLLGQLLGFYTNQDDRKSY